MYNSIKITEDGKCRMKITDQDEFIPDSLYLEAICAFVGVTELLFEFMGGWAYTKSIPGNNKV